MTARDQILDALNAERYGPPMWFKPPPPEQRDSAAAVLWDDSDTTCARRRRLLAEDFARVREEGVENAV